MSQKFDVDFAILQFELFILQSNLSMVVLHIEPMFDSLLYMKFVVTRIVPMLTTV
jgi:hypothetical protein